ncbi:MAG: hypothetical protein MJ180_04950 [Candidatus Gastranaerophilales bacterium]|nr:hypothetical protein [Candidatus Gastranaerophilales bacterium]
MTTIISGFPGIGKTFAQNSLTQQGFNVSDSDSSHFSWLRDESGNIKKDLNGVKIRHPEFPRNYINHIKSKIAEGADVVFVSSHDNVRNALNEAQISHTLVFPSLDMKAEMIERYIKRGSPESFIELMKNNWENFITGMKNDLCPNKIELKSGEYLMDVIKKLGLKIPRIK